MKREIKFRAWDGERKRFSYFHLHQLEYRSIEFCQYTGLLDCNGKEIFEGDILDFDEHEWGGRFKPEVILMENIIGDWNYCGSLNDVREWRKVIGNIYENPELLSK